MAGSGPADSVAERGQTIVTGTGVEKRRRRSYVVEPDGAVVYGDPPVGVRNKRAAGLLTGFRSFI